MSKKIYEYKDQENWFIGKPYFVNLFDSFGDTGYEDRILRLGRLFDVLTPPDYEGDSQSCVKIEVLKLQSESVLLQFALDMLNDIQNRQLKLTQHQGAVLITEKDQLLLVHLPEAGVPLTDFFGQAKQGFEVGDTILIATRNEGKTKEFRQMFDKLGIKVANLNDYPDLPDVEETGTTFEENARLKAETIAELTGRMVLADDSGLKVDVLGGLPGVWSARFSGPDATDAKNNDKLLHELAMVFDLKDRTAQFHSTLVVAKSGKDSLVVSADWEGYIGFEEKGDAGFGYDPLFLVGETGQTAAQLSPDEKNALSHRGLALKKLLEVFPTWQHTN